MSYFKLAAFGAGIDLTVAADIFGTITQAQCPSRAREQLRKNITHMQDAFTACEQCSMPVIAAVQGENPLSPGCAVLGSLMQSRPANPATFAWPQVSHGHSCAAFCLFICLHTEACSSAVDACHGRFLAGGVVLTDPGDLHPRRALHRRGH